MNRTIFCPCQKYVNNSSLDPQTIEEHLVWNGFVREYTEWVFHGESMLPFSYNQSSHIEYRSDIGINNLQRNPAREDDIRDLLRDAI